MLYKHVDTVDTISPGNLSLFGNGIPIMGTSREDVRSMELALHRLLDMTDDPLVHLHALAPDTRSAFSLIVECVALLSTMNECKLGECRRLIQEIERKHILMDAFELLHLNACKKWLARDLAGARHDWLALLCIYPQDGLAVYAVHMLDFYLGNTAEMPSLFGKIAGAWRPTDPLYGFIKGMESFAYEENGHYERAIELANEALSINPRDIYAIHAVAHAYYELGQYQEAIEWMDQRREHWADNLGMRIHVWWHYAVFHLYLNRVDRVREIYKEQVRNKNCAYAREDLDAVTLLWRLWLVGVDVREEWQQVALCWASAAADSSYSFNDMHALMAFIGAGYDHLASHLMHRRETTASVPMDRDVPDRILHALLAFARGDYADCLAGLIEAIPESSSIGGSNAQRDVLEMTAIEAALRNGDKALARSMIEQGRCFRHPSELRDLLLVRCSDPRVSCTYEVSSYDEQSLFVMPKSERDAVRESLRTTGMCHVTSDRLQIDDFSEEEWHAFRSFWDDLVVDRYLRDGKRYRERRCGMFRYHPQTHQLESIAVIGGYYQSSEINAANGGKQRVFGHLDERFGSHWLLHRFIRTYFDCLPITQEDREQPWRTFVHPFRITAHAGECGRPSPEGPHQDGHQFTVQIFIQRQNVRGAQSMVYSAQREKMAAVTMLDRFEAIILDDQIVYHDVSDIEVVDSRQRGLRDIFTINYNRFDRPMTTRMF